MLEFFDWERDVHLFARLIEAFQTDQVSLMHSLSIEPSSWRHTTTAEALTGERLSVIDNICRSGINSGLLASASWNLERS